MTPTEPSATPRPTALERTEAIRRPEERDVTRTEQFPMFPLGTVLFPHALLPVHVFEPRYRALTQRCLEGDKEFGVVLIERGHEVGGGDVRFDVGTVARIVQAGQFDDGRWMLVTVGVQRFRVVDWLPDDPHPLAHVERLDEHSAPGTATVADLTAQLRRVLAMRSELGEPVPTLDVDLADDTVQASFEAAALAPLGPLDAQRLLELDRAGERIDSLSAILREEAQVLEQRLSGG
jgi:ATP-dependent Lon protease